MPVPAGRDERPVPRHGTIIGDRPTREGRYRAACFVHQKIGRRKIPVVAVAAGDGDVERALRDAGETQRERWHPRHRRHRRCDRREAVEETLRPGDAGVGKRRPVVAAIGAPLRVAPAPATAANISSVTGANRPATIGRPSSTSATETVQSGAPAI